MMTERNARERRMHAGRDVCVYVMDILETLGRRKDFSADVKSRHSCGREFETFRRHALTGEIRTITTRRVFCKKLLLLLCLTEISKFNHPFRCYIETDLAIE